MHHLLKPSGPMSRLLLSVAIVGAIAASAFLPGCATTSSTVVPTATLNDQVAVATEAVTLARQTSTALLRAGKITLAQDQATQAKLNTIDANIAAASTVAQVVAQKTAADAITTANGGTPK